MTHTIDAPRVALPAPACMFDEGLRDYVASLDVEITAGGGSLTTTGTLFEILLAALRMRTIAFDVRTGGFKPGSRESMRTIIAIDRGWSAIDSFDRSDEYRGVARLAEDLSALMMGTQTVSWRQAN